MHLEFIFLVITSTICVTLSAKNSLFYIGQCFYNIKLPILFNNSENQEKPQMEFDIKTSKIDVIWIQIYLFLHVKHKSLFFRLYPSSQKRLISQGFKNVRLGMILAWKNKWLARSCMRYHKGQDIVLVYWNLMLSCFKSANRPVPFVVYNSWRYQENLLCKFAFNSAFLVTQHIMIF